MQIIQSRRDFLASAVIGRGHGRPWRPGIARRRGAAGDDHDPARPRIPRICIAPGTIAEDLLRAEGFTDIRYIRQDRAAAAADDRARRDRFQPSRLRAHGSSLDWMPACRSRCWPVCTPGASSCSRTSPSAAISDLKGKQVGIAGARARAGTCTSRSWRHMSGSTPHKDIDWVTNPIGNSMELFAEGKIDAFLGFPPEPQELRARKIGHVILNTATDRPWSQYFCCMLFGNTGLRPRSIRSRPSASCAPSSRPPTSAPPSRSGPRSSWSMAASREHYDYALQTLTELPYDTLARATTRRTRCGSTRFGSTRSGMINVEPQRRSSPRAPTGASSTS